MTPAQKAAKKGPNAGKAAGFTADEKAAMREHVEDLKAGGDGERALLAKVAQMKGNDKAMAQRIHAIVRAAAPGLEPKTWYGMPAYAKDGKVVCFFQAAAKFKARYATFGFNDAALLDEGPMWPTSFALKELTPAGEAKLAALVQRAVAGGAPS